MRNIKKEERKEDKKLRDSRISLGLTTKQVAALTGVSASYISELETGTIVPKDSKKRPELIKFYRKQLGEKRKLAKIASGEVLTPGPIDDVWTTLSDEARRTIKAVPKDEIAEIMTNIHEEQKDFLKMNNKESVNHPNHYKGNKKYEVIDVIEDWKLNFNLGNVIKYIGRCGLKDDPRQELEKAAWYLKREIDNLKR